MPPLDFASALYLGFSHASTELAPWQRLSLGKPAMLAEFDAARATAQALAQLVGSEAGCLLPSTLHLFWDLLGVLAREPIEIFMDAAAYPIARWSAEHCAARGVPLQRFADAAALQRLLRQRSRRRRPVLLCDGFVPGAKRQPPLALLAQWAGQHGGWLVIDDTQALGVHGARPRPAAPYGEGGGGSLSRHGIAGGHVIVGASLAKGLGVPVALLAGSRSLVAHFEQASATREHTSPPSMAVVLAAQHALALNRAQGQWRRLRLWQRVQRLRQALARVGWPMQGGDFPVQSIVLPPGASVAAAHERLRRRGLLCVPQRARAAGEGGPGGARLALVVNATHSALDIDRAAALVAQELSGLEPPVAGRLAAQALT